MQNNWRAIGFGNFLEKDEFVYRVFREPLIFAVLRMILRVAFWGAILFLIFFFLPDYLRFLLPVFAVVGIYFALGPICFWYVNGIVMTNESVVFVSWTKFFHRKCERIDWHNLDEIEVERLGVQSFFWNYGTLRFQKVNGGEQIEMHRISSPKKASRVIEHHRETFIDHKNFTEESALKDLLSQLVQTHVKTTGQPQRDQNNTKKPIPNNYTSPKKAPSSSTHIEKYLDDTGGLEIDLTEEKPD